MPEDQQPGTTHIPRNEERVYPLVEQGIIGVGTDGSVWRLVSRTGGGMKPLDPPLRIDQLRPDGYRRALVNVSGKDYSVAAHRLLWRVAYGPIPPGMEVNHRNGNRSNNDLSNLEVVTPLANTAHAIRVLGRQGLKGERNGRAKLTAAQATEIRRLRSEGARSEDLAVRFGVTRQAVNLIFRGVTWRDAEVAS